MDTCAFSFFEKKKVTDSLARSNAQVLQTLLLLVQNLRSRPALFCLFSNNHISHILRYPFDFSDEEVVALFVNLLRLISARLDEQVVHFFFMETPPGCPLMESTIPLFTHSEQLVRIAARTTTLNIYRLRGSLVENYLTLATQVRIKKKNKAKKKSVRK